MVDLTMTRYYKPGDLNSSPYEPAMGDIVLYRTPRQGRIASETFPAIVIKAHPNDRVDLTVFTTTGVRHIVNVRYSGDDTSENTYGWMPEKQARLPEPVDKAKEVAQASK